MGRWLLVYEAQTESVIRQRMLDLISTTIDKAQGSLTYDAIAPTAVELTQMYIELDRILTLVFAQTSNGTYLDNRAGEFGITRKAGTKATGAVTFSGVDGTIIPLGTQVRSTNALVFVTTEEETIFGGSATPDIEAAEIGTAYNVGSATITNLPIAIIGISSISNFYVTSGGTDIETDADLLARLLIKVQTPATSGNATEYKVWALSVDGVGDAIVYPIWDGNGTVKIFVIGNDKLPVAAGIVTDVGDYIETVRPIGATVTVVSATALTIDVSVDVVLAGGYSLGTVTTNITEKITAYLKSIAFLSSYVSYAQIGNAIIDSEGVLDYSSLTVNSGTSNVSITTTSATTQTPQIGSVTVV
jgi:uncharacterized phage protein gp47/JayE